MDTDSTQLVSRLLSLPTELRLSIWEFLLAPEPRRSDKETTLTIISRSCSAAYATPTSIYPKARAHEWNDWSCDCQSRAFYILDAKQRLFPTVLRVNRQVYQEALPCLYQYRTFIIDPNRTYESLHDRMSDSWLLFDRFLASLSEYARSHVRSIKIPMLLSSFEVYGCRQAFYSISPQLRGLRTLDLEVCPSSVREHWRDESNALVSNHHANELINGDDQCQYWLGPVMAFADAAIKITAVDKHDIGPVIFERLRTGIEVRVWKQLLPLRMKRERRKISRIRRALAILDYDDATLERSGFAMPDV